MKYLSLFSGIEAASAAWQPLGWECVAVSEIEPFPCAVLAHHHPGVPNLGDVTQITEFDIMALGPIDLVVFGSPCQDLSVAGNRKGLINADGTATRSGLFFTALDIFQWARKHCGARFALWENVPGAFSSNKGRDFGAVVEWMAGVDGLPVPPKGWGTEGVCLGDNGLVEWAVLDAQWFGVAQRRRRVFALLDTGDWAGRPPILLEPESLRGDTAPRREPGQGTAHPTSPCLTSSGRGVERTGDTRGQDPVVAHTLRGKGFDASEDGTGRGTPLVPVAFDCKASGQSGFGVGEVASTMRAMGHADSHQNGGGHLAVAVSLRGREGGATAELGDEVGNCLRASGGGGDKAHVLAAMQVRRLTPIECEFLQGFPRGYTAVPYRNKPAADGPRYKALGNSMAVPVMRWIGMRVQRAVDLQGLLS